MAGQADTYHGLGGPARIYLAGVSACAFAAVGVGDLLQEPLSPAPDWALLAVAIALCLAGKAFEIFAPGHYALQPNYVGLVGGCLLLPAWAAPSCSAAPHRSAGAPKCRATNAARRGAWGRW